MTFSMRVCPCLGAGCAPMPGLSFSMSDSEGRLEILSSFVFEVVGPWLRRAPWGAHSAESLMAYRPGREVRWPRALQRGSNGAAAKLELRAFDELALAADALVEHRQELVFVKVARDLGVRPAREVDCIGEAHALHAV